MSGRTAEQLKPRLRPAALFLIFLAVSSGVSGIAEAQVVGSTLRIEVLDQTNQSIEGAHVVATPADGIELKAAELGKGIYELAGIRTARYAIRIDATDFVTYRQESLMVNPGADNKLTVVLRVRAADQYVFVTSALPTSAIPEFVGGVRILRGDALNNLPDTAEGLFAYLRLLAPQAAGPFGPAIMVDGFSAASLPPKASIREIRINDNPFSAEYGNVGSSRIEIFTKPGTEIWQSTVFLNFNDESLNSRNTFSPARAPFQNRIYGLSLTGPVVRNKVTVSIDTGRVERDDNTIINATTLDSALRVITSNRTLIKPARDTSGTIRANFQLAPKNTLAANFRFAQQKAALEGVGEFSLESRAYESLARTHTVQLTETAILGDRAINETRFQLMRRDIRKIGNDSVPTIEVPQAFIGGGSETGRSTDHDDSLFVSNFTTFAVDNHTFKAGAELRTVRLRSQSATNAAGTYVFAGRIAPQLDEKDAPVLAPNGQPFLVPITNIESYRRTLLFQQKGLPAERVRALGGGATQFSISSGAEAKVRQFETAAFLQDDWRARSNVSLKLGVRFETQNNIRQRVNLAPRFSISWEPHPRTVVRAGSGVFFDRVTEDLTMQASLLSGNAKRQFFTTDANILNSFPATFSADSLTNLALSPTVWLLASDMRAPYKIHSSLSFEQVMPLRSTFGLTLAHSHGVHTLRARNINAPLPNGSRPQTDRGEIFQFESSGVTSQKQLSINTTHNVNDRNVLWITYTLSDAQSDTDGPFTLPANTYDLRSEYGRTASTARHTFYAGGWFRVIGGIEFTPLVMWRSGLPFNITTGRDNNGDSQFTERPAFATDVNKPSVVQTRIGSLDLEPPPDQRIIPRNFGTGPGFKIVNLRMSRYFRLGTSTITPDGAAVPNRRLLTLAVQVQNLFNNSNFGTPIGNLSSPLFGRSIAAAGDFGFGSNSAGTRRLDFTIALSF